MPDLVACTPNVKFRTAQTLRDVAQVKEDSNSGHDIGNTHPDNIGHFQMLAEIDPVSHDEHTVQCHEQEHQGGHP